MKWKLLAFLMTLSALGARTGVASDPADAAHKPQAQVLIEAVILQITASGSNSLGTSYLARETQIPENPSFGAGALSRSNLLSISRFDPIAGTNAASAPTSGFEYLAKPCTDLDSMVQALTSDSRVRILQRPRIQTSDGVRASLFVGESRPYSTNTGAGGAASSGYSSIQQLQVGVTFEVTPVIKPDGIVMLDIHQKIDRVVGTTNIVNVGEVPITSSTEAQAKVVVHNRETILLGGIMETDNTRTPSGVPVLKDIPLLGSLLRSSSARMERNELIVLVRPTILPVSEAAVEPVKVKSN
jgi:general secretion pathway protein D